MKMMLDIFDQMVLIQAHWSRVRTQTVRVKMEQKLHLNAQLKDIEENDGDKVYTVVYQDKNSPYYEKSYSRGCWRS